MKILIPNKKLKRTLEDDKSRTKNYGAEMAKKIRARLEALAGAETLADFTPAYSPPERTHELQGKEAGTFSMDLKHPFRLLFKPIFQNAKPNPAESSELQIWQSIDTIEIISIEDTHG